MAAATLAWAWLALLGQVPGDVMYTNQLNHRLDVQFKVQRTEIRELRLYSSTNQGRDWELAARIDPDKDFFVFKAPGGGVYWLRVASMNNQGVQFPDDLRKGPPNYKMIIDTQKPIMRTLQARRDGSAVEVNWEIQEEYPDAASFRLEYQAKGAATALWTAVPAPAAPSGKARFQPGGTQALQVRLSLRDLAGNESFAIAEVPGDAVTPAGFNSTSGTVGAAPAALGNTLPAPVQPIDLGNKIAIPRPRDPTPTSTDGGILLGPESSAASVNSTKVAPPPIGPAPIAPPPSTGQPAPVRPPVEERQVIASSTWAPPPTPGPAVTVPPAPTSPAPTVEPAPTPAPATKPLPPLQYINQLEFVVEYELAKVGPSGIGSVELYRTRDEGQTWQQYAYDAAVDATSKAKRLQRVVQFQQGDPDGIYGFTLVVKNRAKIGRQPPQPGELPEVRVELDTTRPNCDLYAPMRDVEPGHLRLLWKATDKNLTPTPISLEWAEERNGPWHPIGIDLPNTGSYSWKLPEEMPVNVYLQLRVRDLAGNEAVTVTPQPLPVDLHEPEGHLLRVSVPGRP
jgi:hypothetical protein